MKEAMEWRPIPSFPNYQIAPNGQVRLVRTGSILPVYRNHNKALFVHLVKDGVQVKKAVKHLMSAVWPEKVAA